MTMSGAGASTYAVECPRAATSRLTEVTTTILPVGPRRPVETGPETSKTGSHLVRLLPSKEVPLIQMQCRTTAILRGMATFAFLMPIRLADFTRQALRKNYLLLR
ncbi:hypothetical protein LMTR3_21360 [Bradyrhizobium sp. LMTR 3]|nr:hypothetical protein LMTR3_21360 [Bradyrhizobium sp. LMTR 3]